MLNRTRQDTNANFSVALVGQGYQEFLAALTRKRETKNYLEIGVLQGELLARIACDTAIGIDPAFRLKYDVTAGKRRTFLYRCTSDRFFAETELRGLLAGGLDLAFLDGLHQFEFLLRDFFNTERACDGNGLIVMHDCLPLNLPMTTRDPNAARSDPEPFSLMWTGDVWKIVPILRKYRPDLDVTLVDCPPTGLVCVTGLDPSSRVLPEAYRDIVREFRSLPNDAEAIAAMYRANPLVSSARILNGQDHSLYFRV